MFIHANTLHLLSNLIILILVGMQFEERVGSRKFIVLYIGSGIASTLFFYLFHFATETGLLLGASGAIFGILGAFLILYPEDEIAMFLGFIFFSKIKVKYVVLVLFIYESILTFFVINDNIAHIGHVGGAIAGMVLAKYIPSFNPYNRINYDFLESNAKTNTLKELLKKIKEEKDMDIKLVLVDSFLNKVYGEDWEHYKKKAFRKF